MTIRFVAIFVAMILGVLTSGCDDIITEENLDAITFAAIWSDLDDDNPKIRADAIYRLSMRHDDNDFINKRYIEIASDVNEDTNVRLAALRNVDSIGEGNRTAYKGLVSALIEDENPYVQAAAVVRYAYSINDPTSFLITHLEGTNEVVREYVAVALGVTKLFGAKYGRDEIPGIREKVVPLLRELISCSNFEARVAAAIGLAAFNAVDEEVDKILAEGITSSTISNAVFWSISDDITHPLPEVHKTLKNILKRGTEGPEIEEIVDSWKAGQDFITHVGIVSPGSVLHSVLVKQDPVSIDVYSADIYGTGFSKFVLHFENRPDEALSSYFFGQRFTLYQSLNRIGYVDSGQETIDILLEYLNGQDDSYFEASMDGLAAIGPSARLVIPDVLQVVRDESLARYIREKAVETFVALNRDDPKSTVAELITLLDTGELTESALKALQLFGSEAKPAESKVRELLENPDLHFEYQAGKTLISIWTGDENIVYKIGELYKFGPAANAADEAIGDYGVDGLMTLLRNANFGYESVGQEYANITESVRKIIDEDPASKPLLLDALENESVQVRLNALVFLSWLEIDDTHWLETVSHLAESDNDENVVEAAKKLLEIASEDTSKGTAESLNSP